METCQLTAWMFSLGATGYSQEVPITKFAFGTYSPSFPRNMRFLVWKLKKHKIMREQKRKKLKSKLR
jgi:hypothetical protein